jgi:uncharacterized LabA/DUF88 family protein
VEPADFEKHFTFRKEFQQKGVDGLIVLDLVQLSRDRVVDLIVLVSGDRDLAEAVRVAQSAGCRVVIAHPPGTGVALALRQLADGCLEIDRQDLEKMLVARKLKVLTGQAEP